MFDSETAIRSMRNKWPVAYEDWEMMEKQATFRALAPWCLHSTATVGETSRVSQLFDGFPSPGRRRVAASIRVWHIFLSAAV